MKVILFVCLILLTLTTIACDEVSLDQVDAEDYQIEVLQANLTQTLDPQPISTPAPKRIKSTPTNAPEEMQIIQISLREEDREKMEALGFTGEFTEENWREKLVPTNLEFYPPEIQDGTYLREDWSDSEIEQCMEDWKKLHPEVVGKVK